MLAPRSLPPRRAARPLAAALFLAAVAACGETTSPARPSASPQASRAAQGDGHGAMAPVVVTAAHEQAAAVVRQATAAYADLAVAKAAGYAVQFPAGCAASPEGAQGFHWLNESLVDNHVNLQKPELLMYEPQADGRMVLVGVDYVIPFDQWKSPQPPRLLGVPMMRNEPLKVWALHIWAQRANPTGLFAPWNPTVSCAAAS